MPEHTPAGSIRIALAAMDCDVDPIVVDATPLAPPHEWLAVHVAHDLTPLERQAGIARWVVSDRETGLRVASSADRAGAIGEALAALEQHAIAQRCGGEPERMVAAQRERARRHYGDRLMGGECAHD